jgi:ABC-type oligopeptide transport system substrate-binding subunit
MIEVREAIANILDRETLAQVVERSMRKSRNGARRIPRMTKMLSSAISQNSTNEPMDG